MSVGGGGSAAEDDAAAQDEGEWWAGRAFDGDVAGAPPLAPPASSNGQVRALSPQERDDDAQEDGVENGDGNGDGDAGQAAKEEELAVLGDTCPICLQTLAAPVMLRACFHVFCGDCLRTWAARAALLGVRPPPCPLCKARFDAAYANVRSETDFELVYFDGRSAAGSRRISSPLESRERVQKRELVYRRRLRLASVNGAAVVGEGAAALPGMAKLRGEYEPWLQRELRACIGRDVDLTVLLAIVRCCLDKMPRFGASACYKELEAALAPFLYEDAALFVRELAYFLASRLNADAYDDAVEYRCGSSANECAAELCPFHHEGADGGSDDVREA